MNGTDGNGTEVDTSSPSLAPNKCQEFEPGDIVIFVMTSDDPDYLAFFALVDIFPEVGSLYMTDNAWTGTDFASEEGTLKFDIPDEGIEAGLVFGYESGDCLPGGTNWTITNTNDLFDFSARGDQILLYCLAADNSPHFIWGFNYNGDWASQNLTEYGTNSSALPDELAEQGNVALPHCDNYLWRDPNPNDPNNNKTVQLAKFLDANNYECSNDVRYVLNEVNEMPCSGTMHSATSWLAVVGMVTWLFWT